MIKPNQPIKVGILPHDLRYQVKLGSVPLQSLDWPGQVAPKSGTIADLTARDHVVVYPSSKRLLRSFGPLKCKVDLLMSEPLVIHGDEEDDLIVSKLAGGRRLPAPAYPQ